MKDNELIKSVSKHLDEQTDSHTDELAHALKHARQTALDKAENSSVGFESVFLRYFKPLPISAFATACLLVVVFFSIKQSQIIPPDFSDGLNELADIEIFLTDDNLEFYEDLEFYEWLLLDETHSG